MFRMINKIITLVLFFQLSCFSNLVFAQDWSLTDIRDRMMIEELMNDYLYALDRADPEAYAAVFALDGELIVRETDADDDYHERGREEIKSYVVGLRAGWGMPTAVEGGPEFGPIRHVYYNFIVSVNGNTATAETYWTTMGKNPEGGAAVIASMGRSEDDFIKIEGQWLFQKRVIIVDMDT